MYREGWSYNEGLYFTFISLSTIGFGDYVPGVNPSQDYSLTYSTFIIVWCTFGLTWVALLFTLFSKFLEIAKTRLTCDASCQANKTSPVPSILYLWPSLEEQ
ncbi:hypothetical protein HJG60_007842 [Phyllostomus discolor]|uniref:Potassium channel domain-containing protein n=1 Tax=Phyllostomus discolor TaxID=89673 RepID=A0A834BJI2_9CHIR|nr:hypothetical protein HJG60_007842 [Phyllostomus discolor]